MPTATFRMVGTLSLPKESDKFKPYEEKKFNTGWLRRSLKLNVACGTSRHLVVIDGGYIENDPNYKMYTCFREGERYENRAVLFSDRGNPDILENVASFSKFVFDLYAGNRYELENVANGKTALTEEFKKKYSVATQEEAKELLDKSLKKRKEYLSGYDMAGVVHKFISGDKFKPFENKKFLVTGEIEYREYQGKVYETYKAKRIVLLEKAEDEAKGTIRFYFGKDACDGEAAGGFYQVHGWVPCYDRDLKGDRFFPYILSIPLSTDPEKGERVNAIRLKRFDVEDESIREVGVTVDLVDGSLTRKLTLEDLSEDEQDAILCGDTTLEEIEREHGGVVGGRVKLNIFAGWLRGYISGSQSTAYTENDMTYQPIGDEEDSFEEEDENVVEEDIDEYDEDDDDDLF